MNNEEREYQKLSKMGQSLGVIIPECFLEMEVKMPSGKVIYYHKQRSHSWVRNAYNLMISQLGGINASDAVFGAGFINEKRQDGVISNLASQLVIDYGGNPETQSFSYHAGAGITVFGIVVGSSVQAESFEDFSLITPITNGLGAGQLSYNASEVPIKSNDIPSKTYSVAHIRYMNNNTGGDVLINEVALIANANGNDTVKSRDLILATVTIPDTGQLKVTYTISLVYPA